MAHYIVYRYKQDGDLFSASEYECTHDQAAVEHAMELAGDFAVEVWLGNRKVIYIAPTASSLRRDIEQMRNRGELPPKDKVA
jgi:hypothetical protein